jgi:hypothetical protein
MAKQIEDLRATLFDAIEQVKAGTLDLDKARTINEIGKTIVDTAKVEVDHLRVVGKGKSQFVPLQEPDAPALPKGITGIRQHRLEG